MRFFSLFASLPEIESHHGHDAFLMEDKPYIDAVRAFMLNIKV